MADAPAHRTTDITSAIHWAQYSSGDFGAEISLVWDRRYPRAIVMLEAGDLEVDDIHGNDATITGLWQGFELVGRAGAIRASQTAAVLVVW